MKLINCKLYNTYYPLKTEQDKIIGILGQPKINHIIHNNVIADKMNADMNTLIHRQSSLVTLLNKFTGNEFTNITIEELNELLVYANKKHQRFILRCIVCLTIAIFLLCI